MQNQNKSRLSPSILFENAVYVSVSQYTLLQVWMNSNLSSFVLSSVIIIQLKISTQVFLKGNKPPAMLPKRAEYLLKDIKRMAEFYQVPVEISDDFQRVLGKSK